MTHAQNLRIRRLLNRSGKSKADNTFGTPIAGELTPTEIAHRARRKVRRYARKNKATVVTKVEEKVDKPHRNKDRAKQTSI